MDRKPHIILASTSAIRRNILTSASLNFQARAPKLDETAEKRRIGPVSPAKLSLSLAEAKALACPAASCEYVIGSDQVLEFEDQTLDKVDTMLAARERLLRLRGKPHALVGGTALVKAGEVIWSANARSELVMRNFSETELDAYLAKTGARILASVGCYELEREGITLFESLHGEHTAMLGLSLLPLLAALRVAGALP